MIHELWIPESFAFFANLKSDHRMNAHEIDDATFITFHETFIVIVFEVKSKII